MQLKRFSDYSLRLLIHLAVHPDAWVSIQEVATDFSISRNHLLKIVTELNRLEIIQTQRGKHGGIKLRREASNINVGELIAELEGRAPLIDCAQPPCPIVSVCRLRTVLDEAEQAFYQSLYRYSLQDLIQGQRQALLQKLSA